MPAELSACSATESVLAVESAAAVGELATGEALELAGVGSTFEVGSARVIGKGVRPLSGTPTAGGGVLGPDGWIGL